MPLTAGSPQVALGTLNRLRGSVQFTAFPQLNVTASFLGREGISLGFDGDATTYLPQMTGAVISPEPYQMLTVEMHLIKSQNLAALFEAQRLSNSAIGDFVVKTDATTMPTYPGANGAIINVATMRLNGEDAGYVVTVRGTYIINNALWTLT